MNNNKQLKRTKPQEFELVELLFQEYIRPNIVHPILDYSFQARFQSFVDQIPSYLHSSSKSGFFTHFFWGSFATLLDTNLSVRIGITKLYYSFDNIDNLRIIAEIDNKTHIFIFTENINKNNRKIKQDKQKTLKFTKDEWKIIKGREYKDADKDNVEISIIEISKSKGKIEVTVRNHEIQDSAANTKQYNEITRQCVDQNGKYIVLENVMLKLSACEANKSEEAIKFVLKYIKRIHGYYQGLPYGDGAQEADQHGFVAGIFNNFRYRENAHTYLEQFAGRGYADIVLLVRGADRYTESIPIIIELKAGSSSGTTSSDALTQVIEYTKGFQPNNMRILTIPNNILCVGMNLDHNTDSFMQIQLVRRDQEIIPLIQNILDSVKGVTNNNHDTLESEIQSKLEDTYNSFPGTGEKSSAHYFSRFLVGESLLLQDYDKHIFIYDQDEYVATKIIIDQHATRSQDSASTKKQKIEKTVDSSNAITSILLISKDKDNVAIILNIIDLNRKIVAKNIALNDDLIGNKKIISLDIKFNIDQSSKGFQKYCDIQIGKVYNSALEYNNTNNIYAKGDFEKISSQKSADLEAQIKNAIDSQKGLIILESQYIELFNVIAEIIYPIKSLVNNEAEFQGILEGIFKYYSDTKLSLKPERRELVLTEFQTGSGGRIDMLIQAIGEYDQGTKEYIPIGLELKYYNSIKLSSFDKKQDEYIQGLILRHKEQAVVKKLLEDQTERYLQGAAIKSITDSNKVAIMGIVFNKQAKDDNSLLLSTKRFLEANIVHSSKLYSISKNVDIADIYNLPKPDADYFLPDWVETETYDLLSKAQGDDDSMLYLSNNVLNDQELKRLQHLLQKDNRLLQYIDGLDLSFNSITANSARELIKKFRKLVYLNLSDNDLANNNLIDLDEIIEDIHVPILKIDDIGINNEQMGKIFKSLAKHDKVSDLEVMHLDDDTQIMSSDTANMIAQYLRSTQSLNSLNLANNKIGDEAISIIAQGLKQQNTLSSLILTDNNIHTDGVQKLANVLKDSAISYIDLSGNPLGVLGVKAMVEGLEKADNIKTIKLVKVQFSYNSYTNHLIPSLIENLFKNPSLINIDLSYNKIGNRALCNIFKTLSYIGEKSKLKDLSLAGNEIDWNTPPATINTLKSYIYNFLSKSTKIRSLDLSLMGIDDDIGQAIASALEKNVSLINLDLGGNDGIGSRTIASLANVLRTHQYLKYLNLSDNNLSIEDLKLILGSIKMNQVVSHINLSGNNFSGIIDHPRGKQYLDLNNQNIDFENLLQGNTELKYLNLANCKLNQKSLLSLFKAIENNINLEVLDIRDNKIENSIVDSLVESLNKNSNQGLNVGLKVLHISNGVLENSAISKLTNKSLGISVSVDGSVLPNVNLEEKIMQTCTISPLGDIVEIANEYQTFESQTIRGDYHYWLQAHDILDIARIHYNYNDRSIDLAGSIDQLSRIISGYRMEENNVGPLTIILNIGSNGQGSGDHWVTLVLNRVGNQYHGYYINSLGEYIDGNIANTLNQHRILIHDVSIRQQEDGYNCGLWALDNARRICELLEGANIINSENINNLRSNLVESRSEEEFKEIRDSIFKELINDNQRTIHLENIGLPQVEMPVNYNDNYELYKQSQRLYEQCAMLAVIGSSFKIAKSKRSIKATDNRNDNKLLLDSQKFVDCTYDVKQDIVSSQLTSLVNHFKVVGDNKSCKAIDKLVKNQEIINKLNSINKTIPIEIIDVKYSRYNWNPLHKAAQFGDIEEVEKLITQGIDVNIKARDGWRPLHLASQYANHDAVRVLISQGADLHVRSEKWWWSVLHLGSQSGNKEVIRALIKAFKANNKSISTKSKEGWTPLHLAVQLGDKEVIELLVKEGADVNAPAKGGWRPLHLAARYNNTDVVSLLLKEVSEVNSRVKAHNKWAALHFAAQLGNKEMIKLLKDNGADVNICDKDGRTAQEIARESGTLRLVDKVITDSAMDALARDAKQFVKKISTELKLYVEQIHKNNNHQETRQVLPIDLSKVSNSLNNGKISTTTTIMDNTLLHCSSFGCKDATDSRKKRMLEKKTIKNIKGDDIENIAELEAQHHHKHRHHHRADIGHRVHRDIKDEIVSSSASNKLQPIGYSWVKGVVSKVKNLFNDTLCAIDGENREIYGDNLLSIVTRDNKASIYSSSSLGNIVIGCKANDIIIDNITLHNVAPDTKIVLSETTMPLDAIADTINCNINAHERNKCDLQQNEEEADNPKVSALTSSATMSSSWINDGVKAIKSLFNVLLYKSLQSDSDHSDNELIVYSKKDPNGSITLDNCIIGARYEHEYVDGATCRLPDGRGKVMIFPMKSADTCAAPMTEAQDTLKRTSCTPIKFNGQKSVYCEGQKTSVVYTPVETARLFDNIDRNLLLVRVLLHLLQKVRNAVTTTKVKFVDKNVIINEDIPKQWTHDIENINTLLQTIPQDLDLHEHDKKVIDHCNNVLADIQSDIDGIVKHQESIPQTLVDSINNQLQDLKAELTDIENSYYFDAVDSSRMDATHTITGNDYEDYVPCADLPNNCTHISKNAIASWYNELSNIQTELVYNNINIYNNMVQDLMEELLILYITNIADKEVIDDLVEKLNFLSEECQKHCASIYDTQIPNNIDINHFAEHHLYSEVLLGNINNMLERAPSS